jgi:hypothetical protein
LSRRSSALLELVLDLLDPGRGTALVTAVAGRAGNADSADGLVADLDRQPAGYAQYVVDLTRKLPLRQLSIAASAIARAASSETSRWVTTAWAETAELSPAMPTEAARSLSDSDMVFPP